MESTTLPPQKFAVFDPDYHKTAGLLQVCTYLTYCDIMAQLMYEVVPSHVVVFKIRTRLAGCGLMMVARHSEHPHHSKGLYTEVCVIVPRVNKASWVKLNLLLALCLQTMVGANTKLKWF